MIILTLTFGSLVAMGMPIVMAIAGLIVGLGIVGMLGYLINNASTGPTLAIAIGLGVGIDYALFLVTRHETTFAPECRFARVHRHGSGAGPPAVRWPSPAVPSRSRCWR